MSGTDIPDRWEGVTAGLRLASYQVLYQPLSSCALFGTDVEGTVLRIWSAILCTVAVDGGTKDDAGCGDTKDGTGQFVLRVGMVVPGMMYRGTPPLADFGGVLGCAIPLRASYAVSGTELAYRTSWGTAELCLGTVLLGEGSGTGYGERGHRSTTTGTKLADSSTTTGTKQGYSSTTTGTKLGYSSTTIGTELGYGAGGCHVKTLS
eukprot:2374971-Rhodomonas_salina.1